MRKMGKRVTLLQASLRRNCFVTAGKRNRLKGKESNFLRIVERKTNDRSDLIILNAINQRGHEHIDDDAACASNGDDRDRGVRLLHQAKRSQRDARPNDCDGNDERDVPSVRQPARRASGHNAARPESCIQPTDAVLAQPESRLCDQQEQNRLRAVDQAGCRVDRRRGSEAARTCERACAFDYALDDILSISRRDEASGLAGRNGGNGCCGHQEAACVGQERGPR